MIVQRLAQSFRRQDWFAVLVEIAVVMIGLVTAFQVDRWWGDHLDRRGEADYMTRLIAELEEDIPTLDYAIQLAEVRLGFADLLAEVAAEPSVAQTQPGVFLAAVSQAAYTYTPTLVSHTFEDLRSTGNLKLIRNPELIRSLQDYYGYDQNQRQFIGINFMIEFRYLELSAGIITLDQYRFLQDRWFVVNSRNLQEVMAARPEETGVAPAAMRLSKSEDLVAWLPKVRGLQVEQILTHTKRLKNAQALLDTLRAYQSGG